MIMHGFEIELEKHEIARVYRGGYGIELSLCCSLVFPDGTPRDKLNAVADAINDALKAYNELPVRDARNV